MYGLISLIAIGIGLANDAISSNQKYYGTERDSFRNNPRVNNSRIYYIRIFFGNILKKYK